MEQNGDGVTTVRLIGPSGYFGHRQLGHGSVVLQGVEWGDSTSIGAHSFVGRGNIIGARCKIQSHFFVGHEGVVMEDDVFIGPNVTLCNVRRPRAFLKAAEYQKVTIKKGATIGASVTILPGVTIGEYAMVGAGSVVTKDVCHHTLVMGNPARVVESIREGGEPCMP